MKPLHSENFDAEDREHALKDRAQTPVRPSLHHIVRSDLKAFLDGELSFARVWFVRWHLLRCPECREEVNWLKHLGEDMRDLESATPSPRLRARILAALPETPPVRTARSRSGWAGAPRWAPAGLAALAIALGGGIVSSRYYAGSRNLPGANMRPGTTNAGPSPGSSYESAKGNVPAPPAFDAREIPLPHGEDPYSHAADEIVRRWDKERALHVSEKLRQNRSNWDQMLADLHTLDLKKRMNGAEQVRLAVAVVDVPAAEKQLAAWAEAAGGKAALPPDPQSPVHGVAPAALSTQPNGVPAPAAGPESPRVVVMRVPLARAVKLEAVLVRIGALPAGAAEDRSQPGSALAPSEATHPATAVKSADGPAANGNFRDTPDQVAGRDGARLVTLVIEMDALTNNLP